MGEGPFAAVATAIYTVFGYSFSLRPTHIYSSMLQNYLRLANKPIWRESHRIL